MGKFLARNSALTWNLDANTFLTERFDFQFLNFCSKTFKGFSNSGVFAPELLAETKKMRTTLGSLCCVINQKVHYVR